MYSGEEVSEGLDLYLVGSADPDSDRRADVERVWKTLPSEMRRAMLLSAAGLSGAEIAVQLWGSNTNRRQVNRLLQSGRVEVRKMMNGERYVGTE